MAVKPAVPISATLNWTLKANYVWTKTRNYCYLYTEHGSVAGSPDFGCVQGAEVLWETDGPVGFDPRLLYLGKKR
jgi:hypothetical protein